MGCNAQLAWRCLFTTTFIRGGEATSKVGQTDLVFNLWPVFISRSVQARLHISVCSGYDLWLPAQHPDTHMHTDTQTDTTDQTTWTAQTAELKTVTISQRWHCEVLVINLLLTRSSATTEIACDEWNGHSRSLKVIRCCANWRDIYDSLLAFKSNLASIFKSSWDITPSLCSL